MAIDKVKAYLRERGMDGRVLEFDTSSATVELAAQALGVVLFFAAVLHAEAVL